MLTQVASVTLRLLFFRAGPEDFPYSGDQRLSAACIALAVIASATMMALLVPLPLALFGAVVNVGFLALLTRTTLAARKLGARFQQTFNSLVITNGLLTLAMVPFMAQIAPAWFTLKKQAEQNPDLLNHPELWPQIPVVADTLLTLFGIWQLALMGFIFSRAAGARSLLIVAAVFASMVLLMLGLSGLGA